MSLRSFVRRCGGVSSSVICQCSYALLRRPLYLSSLHHFCTGGDEPEVYYGPTTGAARQRLAKPIARPFAVDLHAPDSGTQVLAPETLRDFLSSEGCTDICFIRMPAGSSYCHTMVVCTVRGERHARALAVRFRRLYNSRLKSVPASRQGDYPLAHVGGARQATGADNTAGWTTIDMGDTVVHAMRGEVRRRYDLESLWLLGHDYERLCKASSSTSASVDESELAEAHEDDQRVMQQWLSQLAAEQNK